MSAYDYAIFSYVESCLLDTAIRLQVSSGNTQVQRADSYPPSCGGLVLQGQC